jgi:hypothetical protein
VDPQLTAFTVIDINVPGWVGITFEILEALLGGS